MNGINSVGRQDSHTSYAGRHGTMNYIPYQSTMGMNNSGNGKRKTYESERKHPDSYRADDVDKDGNRNGNDNYGSGDNGKLNFVDITEKYS